MLTEKGTLPFGAEVDGGVHRAFEIREPRIADSIDVYDDPENIDRAEKNAAFMGLCITTRQIVTLGTLPKESITPELIMSLHPDDFGALRAAAARLEERRKSFRSEE